MPANVETMFYYGGTTQEERVRLAPWHGIGTPVEDAPNSKDAIRLAGLDWKVEPKSVCTVDGIEIDGYKANTRDTDNAVLGIVSDKYKVVQNEEAFAFTDSLIGEGCVYETAGSLAGGKRVFLLARMPEMKILDDKVEPYLCFTNTHNGLGAIQVCCTPIRVVCQNTLNLALREASRKWSTKHMGDMQGKLEEAKYTLGMANKYNAELAKEAERLAAIKVTNDEIHGIIEQLFPVDDDMTTRRKLTVLDVREDFMKCVNAEDLINFRNTGWGLVNAASDWMSHAVPKRQTTTYRENNFGKIIDGHVILDSVYQQVLALAA